MLDNNQLEITLFDNVTLIDKTYIIEIYFSNRQVLGTRTILKIINKDDDGIIYEDSPSIHGYDNLVEFIDDIVSEHHENALDYKGYNDIPQF